MFWLMLYTEFIEYNEIFLNSKREIISVIITTLITKTSGTIMEWYLRSIMVGNQLQKENTTATIVVFPPIVTEDEPLLSFFNHWLQRRSLSFFNTLPSLFL